MAGNREHSELIRRAAEVYVEAVRDYAGENRLVDDEGIPYYGLGQRLPAETLNAVEKAMSTCSKIMSERTYYWVGPREGLIAWP